jgi:hypothetical protein
MARLNNQTAIKHGAEGALRRVTAGQPLIGIAKDMQDEVEDAYQLQGIEAIILEGAIGLETVARLFKNAVMAAAEKGDLDTFERYCQRYGWLQSKALLAWGQVQKSEKNNGPTLDAILGKEVKHE